MQTDTDGRDGIVFIVDDDDGVRQSLEMLVRSLGYRSRIFSSGQEFLDAYNGEAGAVLLDVRMPEMNGFEVQQRLHARKASIPVIFLTAQGEENIPPRTAGIERIQKPFRDDELVDRLRELLG